MWYGRAFWDQENNPPPLPIAPTLTTLTPLLPPELYTLLKNVIPKDHLGFFHLNVCLICSFPPCDHDVTFGLVGISITGEEPGALEGTRGFEIAKPSKNSTKRKKKASQAFSTSE